MGRWKQVARWVPAVNHDSEPLPCSKEWIREKWDEDRGTAPGNVLLVKLVHEWRIALPGFAVGAVAAIIATAFGVGAKITIPGFFTLFSGFYVALFSDLWCSTLTT